MLLQEAYVIIAEKTGLDSSSTADKAKMVRVIKEALKEMYRRCKFITLMDENYLTATDGTSLYYLDYRYLYGLEFRNQTASTSTGVLDVYTRRRFEKQYPNPSTTEGTPTLIYPVKKVWVTAQPTAASVVSLTSSSASDITSYYVVVKGISGGLEISERVTLTGATPALTTNSFTSLIAITKDATNGTVTATSNSGAVTNISLTPTQTEKSGWQVKFYPTPDTTYTYYYTFQRKPWVFDGYDEDLLPFDDNFDDAFTLYVTYIVLKMQGDQSWKDTKMLAETKIDEIKDNDYFSEDEDVRMGLIELSDERGDDW